MADGRVLTGFSKPYVAVYSNSGTTVTYSSGQVLARGVSVSIEPEVGDNNDFYADNIVSESVAGEFISGSLTLTVDGLLDAAEKLIFGLPTAGTDGFMKYGDSMSIPYVGIGFVARYVSGGVESFVPVILPKVRFNLGTFSAQTAGESVEWQTQELTAAIYRDDTSDHDWRWLGTGLTTEALAVAKIEIAFSITEPIPGSGGV